METTKNEGLSVSKPGKPENMSHEDLIRTNKKQLIFLQKLKAKSDDLQAKLADFSEVKKKLNQVQKDNSDLINQVKESHEREKELVNSNKNLTEEFDCLKKKQETLNSSLLCLQKELHGVSQEKEALEKASEKLKSENSKLTINFQKVESTLLDSNKQIENKSQQLVALKNNIKMLNEGEKLLKETNQNLESQNKNLKNELSAVKISLDMFKNNKQAANDRENKKIIELDATISQFNIDLSQLKNEKEKLLEEIQNLKFICSKTEADLNSALEKCSILSSKLIENEKSFSSSQEELAVANQKISLLKSQIAAQEVSQHEKQAEIDKSFTLKLQELEAALASSHKEQDHLQNEISQLKVINAGLENSLSEVKSQVDIQFNEWTEKLALSKRTQDDLAQNLKNLNQELNICTKEKHSLTEEIRTKMLEFEEIDKNNKTVISECGIELNSSKELVKNLTTECEELKSSNASLQLRINALEKSENFVNESKLGPDVNESIDETIFKEKYEKVQLECDQLRKKMESFTQKEKAITESIHGMEKENESLKLEVCQSKKDYEKVEHQWNQLNNAIDLLKSDIVKSNNNDEHLQISLNNESEFEKDITCEFSFQPENSVEDCYLLRRKIHYIEFCNQKSLIELSEYKERTNLLEEKCLNLETSLATLQNEYSTNANNQQGKINEIEKLNLIQKSLNEEIASLKVQCLELDKKLKETENSKAVSEATQSELEQKIDLFQDDIAILTKRLEDKELACKQLSLKSDESNQKLLVSVKNQENLVCQLEEKNRNISQLEDDLKKAQQIEEELQSLLKEAELAGIEKIKLMNELTELTNRYDEAQKEHETNLEKLAIELEERKASSQQNEEMYNLKLETLSSQFDELQINYEKIQEENCHLMQEKAKVEIVREELQTSSTVNKSSLEEIHSSNQSLEIQVESLLKERDCLKEHLEVVNATSSEATLSELQTLRQTIQEKETYCAKLKAVAVKAKKELDAAKHQIQDALKEKNLLQSKVAELNSLLMESKAQVMSGAQTLQVECDRLQDEIDLIKRDKSSLQKQLDDAKSEMAALHEQNKEANSKLLAALMDVDKVKMEKVQVEGKLTSSKSHSVKLEKDNEAMTKEKNHLAQKLEAAKVQLADLSKKLGEKEEELSSVQSSLAKSDKQLKQHDLMSLEMAQYEATLGGLQTQVGDLETLVSEKNVEIDELHIKISELNGERKTLEELRLNAEERVTQTREVLDSTRQQVAHLSQVEHEIKSQLDSVNEQLEYSQQEYEDMKMNLALKSSECRTLEEKLASMTSMSLKSADLMERKLKSTQDEVEKLSKEKETLRNDYENYKIRAHSVLKQQKNKESQIQPQPEEGANIAAMKDQLAQLQAKVIELQSVAASRDQELDLLQGDYDRLLRQQQQSSEGALERETRWKSRMKSLQQELLALRKQYDDVTSKLSRQHDVTAASIANAVEVCKLEHEAELQSLQEKLKKKSEELDSFKIELKRAEEKSDLPPTVRSSPVSHAVRPQPAAEPNVDYRSVARESGEGEEHPDEDSVMSFERILQTPRIRSKMELSETASVSSEVHIKQLEAKILAQKKHLEHSTEVARESEENALRLTEQNKLLKEEIRRLEKNQEREKSVANMEYLKNVIYKFLTLPPCDERRHLVPVMDTMLRLSAHERKVVENLADGGESEEGNKSGWGSYLQRWSAMQ